MSIQDYIVKEFKADVISNAMGSQDKSGLIGKWLKTVSENQIKTYVADKQQAKKLVGIKAAGTGKEVGPEIRKMIKDVSSAIILPFAIALLLMVGVISLLLLTAIIFMFPMPVLGRIAL